MGRVLQRPVTAIIGLVLLAMICAVGIQALSPRDAQGSAAGADTFGAMRMIMVQQVGTIPGAVVRERQVQSVLATGVRAVPISVTGRTVPVQRLTVDGGWSHLASGFQHQWPAVYAVARFSGPRLIAVFDDPSNRYRITVDDGAGPTIIVTRPGLRALELMGLGPAAHSVRLDKISQSTAESGTFAGFYVPLDAEVMTPPIRTARAIEFIGDSDTVGYGNLSSSRECAPSEVFLATDTDQSFGPRVARYFGADYQMNAVSGIGVVRNYGGANPGRTMIDLYPRVLYNSLEGPDASWTPDLIVVTIGSNDFATPLEPGERWQNKEALRADVESGLSEFLRRVRLANPQAFLLLILLEEYGPDYIEAQSGAIEALRGLGESRIGSITLPELERTACHWHPSLDDHQRLADAIVGFVEARPWIWDR